MESQKLVGFSRVERSQDGSFNWEHSKRLFLDGSAHHIESMYFICGHWRHQSHPSWATAGECRWCDLCIASRSISWLKAKSRDAHWALPEDADPYHQLLAHREAEAKDIADARKDPKKAVARAKVKYLDTISCHASGCTQTFDRSKRSRRVLCGDCRAAKNRKANRKKTEGGTARTPNEISSKLSDLDGSRSNDPPIVPDRQPAGYKTPAGSHDGRSTYFMDLAGEIDTLCEAAANHPWWELNKGWAADLH